MKRTNLKIFIVMIFLLSFNFINAKTGSSTEAVISQIRAEKSKTDKDKTLRVEELSGGTGVSVRKFYKNDDLKKVIIEYFYEKGKDYLEYYIKDGKLYFVYIVNYSGDSSNTKVENRYYLDFNEHLIRHIDGKGKINDDRKILSKMESEIIEGFYGEGED